MTDDSKQTQKLPVPSSLSRGPSPATPSEPPRSSQRPSLDPEWLDEESSTRDTDSAIALPPITPRHAKTRAVLTVVSGPSTGRVYAIEGDVVLGRGRDCSLRIDDPGASREHARITVTGDHRYVFQVMALDTLLNAAPGLSADELLDRVRGRVLAEGQIIGTFAHE